MIIPLRKAEGFCFGLVVEGQAFGFGPSEPTSDDAGSDGCPRDIQLANINFILVHDAQWTGYEHIAFSDGCQYW